MRMTMTEEVNGVSLLLQIEADPEALRPLVEDLQSERTADELASLFLLAGRQTQPLLDQARERFLSGLIVATSDLLAGQMASPDVRPRSPRPE